MTATGVARRRLARAEGERLSPLRFGTWQARSPLSIGTWAVLIGGVAEAAAFLILARHPLAQSLAFLLPALTAAAIVVRGMWAWGREQSALSLPLAVGAVCYLAADVPWWLYPILTGRALPVPSVVDALFMASYVFYGYFLLRLSARLMSLDRFGALDSIIIALGVSPLLWAGLLAADPDLDLASITQFMYPVATLTVTTIALRLFFIAGTQSFRHVLLFLWISLEFSADLVYALEGIRGTFTFGQPWQVCWILSSSALAGFALHARRTRVLFGQAPRRAPGFLRLPMLGLSLFIPGFVLWGNWAWGIPGLETYALVCLALLIALTLVRLSGLMLTLGDQRREHQVLVHLSADLKHAAFHDSLTGLGNRAALVLAADHALVQRARAADRAPGLLLLDIDNFKTINDTIGHDGGDQLLRLVADRLRSACRQEDTLARLGGDEFVVLVDDTNLGELSQLARRVVRTLSDTYRLAGIQHYQSVSVGLALATEGQDRGRLLSQADAAMYAAKATGGNGFSVFNAAAHGSTQMRQQLERDLRGAVENCELRLEYQPIIDLSSGRICGAEALMRWDHPTRGLIPPDDFIPLAEATGSIDSIDAWALHAACQQLRKWDDDLPGLEPLYMSVNLSRRRVDAALAGSLRQEMSDARLSAHRLLLEITETALNRPDQQIVCYLKQVKDLGCRLAIDDFGTGYSSLAELHTLPVDVIKVDRTFVAGMVENPEELRLVTAILQLAQSMDKTVIAEGIETSAQLAQLRSIGCQQGQGYLFSPSLGPAAFTRFRASYIANAVTT